MTEKATLIPTREHVNKAETVTRARRGDVAELVRRARDARRWYGMKTNKLVYCPTCKHNNMCGS